MAPCEVISIMLKLETDFASSKRLSNLMLNVRGRWDETTWEFFFSFFYYSFHAVTPTIYLKYTYCLLLILCNSSSFLLHFFVIIFSIKMHHHLLTNY